jgi:undecaprenyl-diphosphatase
MRSLKTLGVFGSLAVTSAVAKMGVPAWDADVFRRMNGWSDSLAPVLWAPMQAGALGAPLAVGTLFIATGDRKTGLRIVLTGAAAWGAAKALKREVGRGRPAEFVEETKLRFGSADQGLGYPSGHAAVVSTLVGSIPPGTHPIIKVGGIALATVVGVARIHVGAHFPLDVIGGYALGASIATVYDNLPISTSARSVGA